MGKIMGGLLLSLEPRQANAGNLSVNNGVTAAAEALSDQPEEQPVRKYAERNYNKIFADRAEKYFTQNKAGKNAALAHLQHEARLSLTALDPGKLVIQPSGKTLSAGDRQKLIAIINNEQVVEGLTPAEQQKFIRLLNREGAADPVTLGTRQQQSVNNLKNIEQMLERNKEHEKANQEVISSWDFCSQLRDAINNIDNSYMRSYEFIMGQFSQFYESVANIKTMMAEYIRPGKNGNLIIEGKRMHALISGFMNKYSSQNGEIPPQAILFPSPDYKNPDGSAITQQQAEKWASEMGLSTYNVKQDKNGNWCCTIDVSPLQEIKRSIELVFGTGADRTVDPQQYQAWATGYDTQLDKYQNFLQIITQKFTTANAVFDNLVKVLSSTITALAECDKSFLTQ